MTEVQIEDLKPMLERMLRRPRRSRMVREAEKRHSQFLKDLATYLNNSAEETDRTKG